ncbi:MAG: hypothetical protein IPQ05_10315 [Leptospiraceae bacterium]|nr:hypothetical protein [Leptospiraceae bacterium]MBK7057361.1 hypothetical protein [Leptospiraceae bacterium]MBK9503672.1 hypothetical protein [Leptospiraceae bacterium]MBL0264252.1 hypothetical protein [Leptospiraceae bacterium]HRG47411.1 hypothetical protein [Leptospiraceae bacterium]
MKGVVYKYLNDYFQSLGLSENSLSGKTKIRSIRIQVSLKGINLSEHGPDSIDDPAELEKLKIILKSLNLPAAA